MLKKCLTRLILAGSSCVIRFRYGMKFSLITGKWHLSAEQLRKTDDSSCWRHISRTIFCTAFVMIRVLYRIDTDIHISSSNSSICFFLVRWLPLASPRLTSLLTFISWKSQLQHLLAFLSIPGQGPLSWGFRGTLLLLFLPVLVVWYYRGIVLLCLLVSLSRYSVSSVGTRTTFVFSSSAQQGAWRQK